MYIDECIKVCGGFLLCVLGSVSNNQSTMPQYNVVYILAFTTRKLGLLFSYSLDCHRELLLLVFLVNSYYVTAACMFQARRQD